MTLRAAAEQALDTLEHVQAHIGRYDPPVVTTIARAMQPTIDALRAALAAEQPQPEAQPVAWAVMGKDGDVQELLHCSPLDREARLEHWDQHAGWNHLAPHRIVPLYTAPPPAAEPSAWHAVADWLRDNYQDHPTIADLCDAMRAAAPPPAAPQPEPSADVRLLREMFALCEATEDECADTDDSFKRGRAFEAKRIRRGIGTWYQDTFCGPTHMGEPVLCAAPEPSEAEVAAAMASLHRDMEPAAWPSEDEVTDALRAAAAARGK